MTKTGFHISILALTSSIAGAQVYSTSPNWTSLDTQVSTGAALADINGDGWMDLVVSNGNDISLQRVVVYFNTGAGTLNRSPGWQSTELAYNGHLDVADVNGDGWMDVAVGVLLAQGGTSAKLYLNNGGSLTTSPVWTAPVSGDSFGVAFGDMNGDGRPDLAVASGEAYNNVPKRNCVYLNINGALSPTVSWETSTTRNFNNTLWVDGNRDGRLDLCYTGSNTDTFVYKNLGTTLETAATWRTNDSRNQFALMATYGDVTGDGLDELFIADNNQLFTGSGRFRMYAGAPAGNFVTAAGWTYNEGYAAAVSLADLDADGDLDLCTGEWFGRTRYFSNSGTALPATPTWTSAGTSTVEKIVHADVDNASRRVRVAEFAFTGSKLFHLPHQPVEFISRVVVDGVDLDRTQWCTGRAEAWVSVGVVPSAGVRITYVSSTSLDMAVSNWDSNKPNHLYFNQTPPRCQADFNEDGFATGDDFDAFVAAFETGGDIADVNIDGFVTGDDFDVFVQTFELGC